ncbi:hypothetical protein BDZ91DRAFT_718295 [Kalaharituber pfeilii]|nr:hypothetical protein BDZ91DRAFT_718295 [Kalaharituber pfeilii]
MRAINQSIHTDKLSHESFVGLSRAFQNHYLGLGEREQPSLQIFKAILFVRLFYKDRFARFKLTVWGYLISLELILSGGSGVNFTC